MILKNLQVFPVRAVPTQIRRRIAFGATTSALDDLSSIVAKSGHAASGTQEYQSALADIVGFDALPNGFELPLVNVSGDELSTTQFAYESNDTGVFNFVAVLVADPINETRSQETRYIVTGYTSQAEKSLLGHLPDDMVLYINDIFGLQTVYRTNSFGERFIDPDGFRMVDNYVLSRALAADNYHEANINAINVTKTADMVKKMKLAKGESFVPSDDTLFAPQASTAPQLLSGQLTRPESFVTAISNSYLKTMGQDNELSMVESFFEGTGGTAVEQELQSLGVVRQFSNYELVKAFRSALTTNTGSAQDGWNASHRANFRLRDLRNAVNNPDMVDTQIMHSLMIADRNGHGEVDKTDEWVGNRGYSTQGSLVSYDMAMQLGAILSRNLIGTARFHFDNRHSDFATLPTMEVFEDSITSISENQLPRVLAQRFENDLKMMFVKITKHNNIRCAMNVTALLGTVTRVEILIDGESIREYYTYASFMSGRLHNGNTTSLEYAGKLAQSTTGLMAAIEDGYNEHSRDNGINRLYSNVVTPTSGGLTGNSLLDGGGQSAPKIILPRNSLLD